MFGEEKFITRSRIILIGVGGVAVLILVVEYAAFFHHRAKRPTELTQASSETPTNISAAPMSPVDENERLRLYSAVKAARTVDDFRIASDAYQKWLAQNSTSQALR
jgi:hypothetical protein